eukprot:1152475-Pelagomonas_calceolata.AAC.4
MTQLAPGKADGTCIQSRCWSGIAVLQASAMRLLPHWIPCHWPAGMLLLQAVHVCRALARMPSREKDVLLHHMEFVYGPSTGLYTSNTWNTW